MSKMKYEDKAKEKANRPPSIAKSKFDKKSTTEKFLDIITR